MCFANKGKHKRMLTSRTVCDSILGIGGYLFAKLSFCVADATALSYENENFDCVVISNALHIMPEPEKAMQEIRRVLKKDGILYAPTFLWAEKKSSGLRKRLMSITGFKAYKEWNKENFCEFITDYGFTVVKVNLVDGGLAPVGVLIAKKTNY